jgi:SAM-dependent methyltransferase
MGSYEFLAGSYDQLTADVRYPAWADYLEKHFRRCPIPVRTVLDLACGTGSLTAQLALRGYEMIGVDQSAEMLAVAAQKCRDLPGEAPIFLNQPMEKLDLYGTVDACVCCLDSVNYVTRPAVLRRAFSRVHLFLTPGGLFLFDVKPPQVLEGADGEMYLDETEETYCVWRADYAPRRRVLTYGMDLFRRRPDGAWERGEEVHEEYAYTLEELEDSLGQAGFVDIRRWGNLKLRPPKPGEERVFFTARKEQ